MLDVNGTASRFFFKAPTPEVEPLLKKAGFQYDPIKREWYTYRHGIASSLPSKYMSDRAKRNIDRVLIRCEPWAGAIPHPSGLTPRPFQIEKAVPFALSRSRAYLALDAGLGKTICAALYLNALDENAVYICPPFLVANVQRELDKWLMHPYISPVRIVPDSILIRPGTVDTLKNIRASGTKVLIVDEAHRFCNDTAQRTKVLFKQIFPLFERVLFMSGTPMPNRPMELYSVLSHAAPETIPGMSKFDFGRRYCAGTRNHWGWDFTGASNVPELAKKVQSKFMLRMRKSEVLTELPPKTRSMVLIDGTQSAMVADLSARVLAKFSPFDLMKGQIGDEHLMTYRRKLGVEKVVPAAKYIRHCLESGESLLVFAIHKDVVAGLQKELVDFKPLVIDGEVPPTKRQPIATAFQESKDHPVLVLNIDAGGVGFNLTKATRVVFVEFKWTPGGNEQAEDRAHRIGQKDNVLVDYLVFRNSLDRSVIETVLEKNESIKHI